MQRIIVAVLILSFPAWACAGDAGLPQTEAKRFFPLQGTSQRSDSRAGLRSDSSGSLKSDSSAKGLARDHVEMKNGFMRLDRPANTLSAPVAAVAVTPSDTPQPKILPEVEVAREVDKAVEGATHQIDSEEIAGNREMVAPVTSSGHVNPVLSLFDAESSQPLSSFKDAMRGSYLSGALTRHPVWPIPTRFKQYISSGYGMRSDPFTHRQSFHGGVDIVADEGTTVVATADGVVTAVASDANYGKYITIQHVDGTVSRYGHLSSQSVASGQSVHAGQSIGAVGMTGRATGPHLDFRVSKNNIKYDPLSVVMVPREIAYNNKSSSGGDVTITSLERSGGSKMATNATPRRPMVIQVR